MFGILNLFSFISLLYIFTTVRKCFIYVYIYIYIYIYIYSCLQPFYETHYSFLNSSRHLFVYSCKYVYLNSKAVFFLSGINHERKYSSTQGIEIQPQFIKLYIQFGVCWINYSSCKSALPRMYIYHINQY